MPAMIFVPRAGGGVGGRSSLCDLSGFWDLLQPLQALQGAGTSVPGAWGEPSTLQSLQSPAGLREAPCLAGVGQVGFKAARASPRPGSGLPAQK